MFAIFEPQVFWSRRLLAETIDSVTNVYRKSLAEASNHQIDYKNLGT